MSPRRLVLWVSALRAEDPRDRGQSEDMGSAAGLLPGATSSLSQALPRPMCSRAHTVPLPGRGRAAGAFLCRPHSSTARLGLVLKDGTNDKLNEKEGAETPIHNPESKGAGP